MEGPYSDYEQQVITTKWIGLVLLIGGGIWLGIRIYQCLTTVFSENSVFIQGWTKSPFLGEVALEKNRADYSRESLDALIDYIRSSIY